MKRACVALLAAGVLVAGLMPAWGRAVSRTPPGEKVRQQGGWSVALVDLINDPGRVDGYWFDGNNHYYYAGDAKAFDRFLQQYAHLEDTPLALVLHPGRGQVPVNVPKWPKTRFDWQLTVVNPPVRGGIVPRGYKPPPPKVFVEIYVGGQVGLGDLEVPLSVDVRSAGEIEKFVAHHEAKQGLTPGPAAPEEKPGGKLDAPPAEKEPPSTGTVGR